jgi:hypothetical protein
MRIEEDKGDFHGGGSYSQEAGRALNPCYFTYVTKPIFLGLQQFLVHFWSL